MFAFVRIKTINYKLHDFNSSHSSKLSVPFEFEKTKCWSTNSNSNYQILLTPNFQVPVKFEFRIVVLPGDGNCRFGCSGFAFQESHINLTSSKEMHGALRNQGLSNKERRNSTQLQHHTGYNETKQIYICKVVLVLRASGYFTHICSDTRSNTDTITTCVCGRIAIVMDPTPVQPFFSDYCICTSCVYAQA